MRIVFVVNSLGTGGAERSLAEMLPFFREAGVRATVVVFYTRNEGVEQQVLDQGFDVRVLEAQGFAGRVRELRGILREVRPHLMHSALMDADLVARGARAFTRTPLVCSLVNMPYEKARNEEDRNIDALRLGVVRAVDATSSRLVDHFHAITHAVKEYAVRKLGVPAEQITVVHRGRDRARLGEPSTERRARARAGLGIGSDELVILNAARREYQKGQRYLLEAFAELEMPNTRLLIAGREGNASDDLRDLHERLGLGERVLFLGHREDIPDLIVACDVFCLPSLWEGLGGVLLEALGLGAPIVCSRLPPAEEVLDEGTDSVLVEPANSAALRDALRSLLANPEARARLSKGGRARFERQFDQAIIASRMLEMFRRHTRAIG